MLERFISITRPGREFEQVLSHGMTVLPHKEQISLVVNGKQHNRAGVLDNVKFCLAPIRSLESISFDVESASL
jgi:hypothetical protein